jgi:two-component system chemotaxis sensor kinase CheA
MSRPILKLAPALEESLSLTEGFALEGLEALETIEATLLQLEQRPLDHDLYPRILRPIHTLRSNAATLELMHLHGLILRMEGMVDWLHRSRLQADRADVALLLETVDRLRERCHELLGDRRSRERGLEGAAAGARPGMTRVPGATVGAPRAGTGSSIDDGAPFPAATSYGDGDPSNAATSYGDGDPSHAVASSGDDSRPSHAASSPFTNGAPTLAAVVSSSDDGGPSHAIAGPASADADAVLESRLEVAWRRLRSGAAEETAPIGELLVQQGDLRREDLDRALELQNQPTGALLIALGLARPEHVEAALARQRHAGPLHVSIRVEARRLDRLTELATSLLATCSTLDASSRHAAPPPLAPGLPEVRRLARLLWGEVTTLRRTPLLGLFQRLQRSARDLAAHLGTPIEVSFRGEAIELEVEYVEALSTVLTHAVRNALCHGIEPPDERRRAQKPPAGRLTFTASREHDEVTLVLADDGRGLDPGRIGARARALGLRDTTGLPAPHRWDVLLEPGFTTVEAPDALSGRGIGLNTVREAVERLKGRVWIESAPGLGTGVVIKLRTRVGFADGIVVMASGSRFVLPAEAVLEYVRPTRARCIEMTGPSPCLPLRGTEVPLVWLAPRLGRCPPQLPLWECLVVIVAVRDMPMGLVVDDLVGPQQVPLVPSAAGSAVPGLAGRVVLEDGEAAELLELEALFHP